MTWQDILHWSPLGIAAASLGIWWALRKKNKLPTVRVILALLVGWGVVLMAGPQIQRLGAWIQARLSGFLPGNWSLLIPVLLAAFVFFAFVIVLHGLHPKERPDKSAEWLAIGLAVAFLLIGGTVPTSIPGGL